MAREWDLDIQAGESSNAVGVIRVLVTGNKVEGGAVEVISPCQSIDDLKGEIDRMKNELDGLMEKARQKVRAIQSGSVGPIDPVQVWKKMDEAASDQEMFDYFNALDFADRERVADYVFTRVSMFKGRGPVFSEHYEAATHLLK